jgi:hypothetical protein
MRKRSSSFSADSLSASHLARKSRDATPERGGETPIKIPDEILTIAKDSMLKLGGVPPTLFVLGTKHKTYMLLPEGETPPERVHIMTQAGVQLAKSGEVDEVEQVFYVSEGWASPPRTPFIRPSQDPKPDRGLIGERVGCKDQHANATNVCLHQRYKAGCHRP